MQDPNNGGAPAGVPALSPSPTAKQIVAKSSDTTASQSNAATGDTAQTASSLATQAKQKLTDTFDGQKGAAADLIENFAQTVHRSGEQFQGRQDWIASAVQRGAAELNMFATGLREKNVGEIVNQAQVFAQRQPALFMGAALAAGFAVARLGKVVAGDLSRDDLPTVPDVSHGSEAGNGQH